MKTKTLSAIAKIASRISNPNSLVSLYRSIEIGTNDVKCCSEFGNLKILTDDTGLKSSLLLDYQSLMSVVSSLHQDADITLEEKGNKVSWSCENAKGSLNSVQTDDKIPEITHQNFPWVPDPNFGNALLLASSACQAAAVSFGLYGIVVEPDNDKVDFMSSNTIAIAKTSIPKTNYPGKKVTIRPPVPGIIAALLVASPNCTLDICDDGIFMLGDRIMAHLPFGADLEHDLKSYMSAYPSQSVVAKISSYAVKKFLTRAKNLTDRQSTFNISLKVEQGKLVLQHEGIGSSSEEWFLAEGIDSNCNYQSQIFPADMLLLPLEFISEVILDYLPNNQLILKGYQPEFTYVVGGND